MRTYGTLTLNRGDDLEWVIEAAPHVHLRAKRIFGKLGAQHQLQLTLKHNDETSFDLEWFLDRYPLQISDADQAFLEAAADRHDRRQAELFDMTRPGYAAPTFALAKPARSYQALEAAIYLKCGGLLVGDDVGLGKTITAAASFMDKRTLPAVVVCPAHLPRQWEAKLKEFAPELVVHRIKKTTPYPLPRKDGRGPDVLILSYHKVAGWYRTLGDYAKSVVFDEVHELRRTGDPDKPSKKYSASAALAHQMDYRLGLSATPIFNYGAEIWNPMNVLVPGALGSRHEFETEWCVYGRLKDPRAFGAYMRDNHLMIRHTRKDVGRELPKLIRIPNTVDADERELSKAAPRAAELARIILSQTERRRGEAFEAAQEFSYLMRQMTGIAKAPFVADYVEMLLEGDRTEPVVLVGWHREVYNIWKQKLAPYNPVLYTGSESASQKEKNKDAFMNGQSRVLLLSLRSGAGLDGLQHKCSTIVFGELDWSPAVIEQCIGRVYRDGQPNPVAAHFLLADDGADPVIAQRLDLKSEQLNGIRNPDAEIFEELEVDRDHIKRLAAHFLHHKGISLEAAS